MTAVGPSTSSQNASRAYQQQAQRRQAEQQAQQSQQLQNQATQAQGLGGAQDEASQATARDQARVDGSAQTRTPASAEAQAAARSRAVGQDRQAAQKAQLRMEQMIKGADTAQQQEQDAKAAADEGKDLDLDHAFEELFGSEGGASLTEQSQPRTPANAAQEPKRSERAESEGELKRLEDHLQKNFDIRQQGDQKVVDLQNNQRDDISVNLRDGQAEHEYEVKVGDQTFTLDAGQMDKFSGEYDFGRGESQDRVDFQYEGKSVTDQNGGSAGEARMFGLADARLGGIQSKDAPAEHSSWSDVDKAVPPNDMRTQVKDPSQLPGPLQEITKNTAKVGSASGTLTQLPNGELGVTTGQHVISPRPGHVPETMPVTIGGKTYQANVHAPAQLEGDALGNKDDFAVLTLSKEDQADLRSRGYKGIPMAQGQQQHNQRVISAGYPQGLGLTLSQGRIQKTDAAGPETPQRTVDDYNGRRQALSEYGQGVTSTSTSVSGGNSGGGLFQLNPKTGQPELIGVHQTGNSDQITYDGDGSGWSPSGVHVGVNPNKVKEWLRRF